MNDSTRRCRTALFAGILVLGTGAVGLSATANENAPGRYQMQKTDDGILRLDTQTGQMSLCSNENGGWSCDSIESGAAATSSGTSGDRLARLERENARLKDDIKRLEDMIGLDGKPKPRERLALPSEEDVDRAMTMVEKMLKRFKEALKDLEQDGTPDAEKKGTPL